MEKKISKHLKKVLIPILVAGCIPIVILTNRVTNESEKVSYASINNSEINGLYSSLVESQQNNVYIDDYYSGLYFNNLRTNFGNNLYGSCTYVSLGMLLSFYDSYWNDSFVPEQFDVAATFQSTRQSGADFEFPPFDVDSPGSAFESASLFAGLSPTQYIDAIDSYADSYLDLALMQIGLSIYGINHSTLEDSNYIFGLTHYEMINVLDHFLNYNSHLSSSDYTIAYENQSEAQIRSFAISKIIEGLPVILRAKNAFNDLGHAFIAYDYDEENDEIYVHTGWRDENNNTALTHVSLTSLGFNELWDATTIIPNTNYGFPMNYSSSSGEDLCSSSYIFPQCITTDSSIEYCRDKEPKFIWKSLYNEKWAVAYNPFFKISILNRNKQTIFTTTSTVKEFLFSKQQWQSILNNPLANRFYVYLQLDSISYPYWDDYWSIQSFSIPKNYSDEAFYIAPHEYGFSDAYPTDSYTQNNFTYHNVRGLLFATRRYRTGYIHNEYVVMSPKRINITEAYIEFRFGLPIRKIEVELSHRREYAYEGLSSSTGRATIDVFTLSHWVQKFDLLSSETNLPTNRNNSRIYTIDFGEPVYNFRFYSQTFAQNSNNNNRGRICIGNLAVFPYDENYNLADQTSMVGDATPINIGDSLNENFQTNYDVDFYRFVPECTNYVQMCVNSTWESAMCRVEVYSEDNLFIPIIETNINQGQLLGLIEFSNVDFYASKDKVYFIKLSHLSTKAFESNNYYQVSLKTSNYANCDSSEFLSRGYISDKTYVYNGTKNIYVYFEIDTYDVLSCGSSYRDIVLDAMSQWNKVGEWQWIEVSSNNNADTVVSTYYEDTSTIAYYSSIYYTSNNQVFRGEMHMNTKYSYYPYSAALHVCVHELGHGLGLGHIDYAGESNVMNSTANSGSTFSQFGRGDLAAYRYLWG